MDKPLEESTKHKAHELAQGITVAHDLDPEIQEELYGHIEDKLLAYIDGEEAVTEEDALILVREHFGDAATVKGMFQDVHAGAVQVTLVRKLLALVITLLAFSFLFTGVRAITHVLLVPLFLSNELFGSLQYQLYVTYPTGLLQLAALIYVLHRWRRGMHTGSRPWFCRWSIMRMMKWILVLFAVKHLVPHAAFSFGVAPVAPSPGEMWLMYGYGLANPVSYCVVWFWWTDVLAGRFLQTLSIGVAWILYSSLSWIIPVKLGILIGSESIPREHLLSFVEFRLWDTEVIGYVLNTWALRPMYMVGYQVVANIICVLLCALVLQGVYRLRHPAPVREDVSSLRW